MNNSVWKFGPDGSFLAKWGSYGNGSGEFITPSGIAVNSSGYVYVTDSYNSRVQIFTSGGTYVTKFGSPESLDGAFINPSGIAVNTSGYVYVADYGNHRIQVFTPVGGYVRGWGSIGDTSGQFKYPRGITVNSSGHVYVADSYNDRIQVFTSSGVYVTKWGSYGNLGGQFNYPSGIALDSSGYVYVADTNNHRIQMFTPGGAFTTTWGKYGAGNGEFWAPESIAADSYRTMYVADTSNHRIQKFSQSISPSKIGVFRNTTHLFYLDYDGNGAWNGASVDKQYNFGISGDIPVAGDWDNNGISEIGAFRPSTHLFYLDYSGNSVWNGAVVDRLYNFCITGDIPVTGDWNNDDKTEIGVFQPSTHLFYLDYNGNGVWNGASVDRTYSFGITGDMPISGDWNSDGRTDILVSGDWNSEGRTEIGVFRPSTHLFYLDYNGNGGWNGAATDRQYNFGISGDMPISGDWN